MGSVRNTRGAGKRRDVKGRREYREAEEEEEKGGGVGIRPDARIARRRRGATLVKRFRVHNFLNIFITSDVPSRGQGTRSSRRN